jgi:hypothetical protein
MKIDNATGVLGKLDQELNRLTRIGWTQKVCLDAYSAFLLASTVQMALSDPSVPEAPRVPLEKFARDLIAGLRNDSTVIGDVLEAGWNPGSDPLRRG